MMFTKATLFTAVAALSQLALAQNTPPGQAKVHIVQVGDAKGGLKFYPEELTALPGEAVQFHFYPKNHSVAQSSFADPCKPISESQSGNGTQGFFSGFMPVSPESTEMPTFTIPIQDDKPIWFYCATGPHCKSGMVGVINAPKNNPQRTLAIYKENAAKTESTIPDEESGGTEGTIGKNSTSTTGSQPSTPSSTSTSIPGGSTGAASTLSASVTVLVGALAAAFFLA